METRSDGISSARFRSGQRRVSGRDIMINGNSVVYDLISIHPGPAPLIIGHYESFNNAIRATGGGGGGNRRDLSLSSLYLPACIYAFNLLIATRSSRLEENFSLSNLPLPPLILRSVGFSF